MKQISCDPIGVTLTAESIKNGAVVIFPTDTVYGIGCNPYDENAVSRIYTMKKRDETKPLPILGYSKHILENIVKFDEIHIGIQDQSGAAEGRFHRKFTRVSSSARVFEPQIVSVGAAGFSKTYLCMLEDIQTVSRRIASEL